MQITVYKENTLNAQRSVKFNNFLTHLTPDLSHGEGGIILTAFYKLYSVKDTSSLDSMPLLQHAKQTWTRKIIIKNIIIIHHLLKYSIEYSPY